MKMYTFEVAANSRKLYNAIKRLGDNGTVVEIIPWNTIGNKTWTLKATMNDKDHDEFAKWFYYDVAEKAA